MSDLISRQAAIDAVQFGITYAKAINKDTGEVKEMFENENKELKKAIERIAQLPSAQPEPKTAYWKKDAFGTLLCSECGGIRRDNRVGHIQWCNSCGCYMRGEQDG